MQTHFTGNSIRNLALSHKIIERFNSRGLKAVGAQRDVSIDDVREILKMRL